MPRWFERNVQPRITARLLEMVREAAQGADWEDACREVCLLLGEFFDSEAVALLEYDPGRQQLRPLVASMPEWEVGGELSLEALPSWQEALGREESQWVEAGPSPNEIPLLAGREVLLFPLASRGRTFGCLVVLFRGEAPEPTAEELESATGLASLAALLLEGRGLRAELERVEEETARRHGVESALLERWLTPGVLEQLAGASLGPGVEAAGLYERQTDGWEQAAAAGATHLLPARLPRGGSSVFPWERAETESRPVLCGPGELEAAFAPWLPELAASGLQLAVAPLGGGEHSSGVLLLCGAHPLGAEGDKAREGTALTLLAASAVAERHGKRLLDRDRWRLQALFDHFAEGVFFLSLSGRLLLPNRALLHLSGFTEEELDQRSLADFLRPAHWERLCLWLQERPQQSLELEVEWRTQAGAWQPCLLRLSDLPPPPEGPPLVLGFVRTRELEPAADEDARLHHACYLGLLDSVQDGVWVLDPAGTVVAANHRLAQLFGVNLQELGPGVRQSEVLERLKTNFSASEEMLARWQELAAQPREVAWDELELLRPRRRVLERYARPLLDAEQICLGRLEVYRDITPQRILQDKVVQREKLAILGQLLSGIAHELNNPLTAVAGYAELLRAESLSPELQEKVWRLRVEAERAGRIVKSLLLFARGDRAEKQPVNVNETLVRALSLRSYELKIDNIQVAQEFSSRIPAVRGDPNQLQQVFLNLLLNAEQAIRSQRQHGRITLRTSWLPEEGCVRVEVTDDGPGIPPAVLPHIFDPFFTTKAAPDGTGLGLSISQAIVREHGGDIRVESSSGGGATFAVELPVEPVAARPRPVVATRVPARGVKKEGQRILVVDDEPVVAHLIADALRQQGHTVRVHTDSRRALAEVFREPFQLIICDIRMPELDGPGFHRLLLERQPGLARRVLFTTGDTLARETLSFLEQTHLPYLAKPFHVDELRSMVSNLLHDLEVAPPAEGAPRVQ